MKIRQPKLHKDCIQTLRRVPAKLFAPHTVLACPVYAFFPKNQKFVAIQAPMSFFTPEELAKYQKFEHFYLPAFVDQVAPFQKAGRSVRALFTMTEKRALHGVEGGTSVDLPLAPHDLADAIVRLIGPLWSAGDKVEPFFLSFFADEVCGRIEPEALAQAADQSLDRCELAHFRSAVAVFLALHVALGEPRHLAEIRARVFRETLTQAPALPSQSESDEVAALARTLVPTHDTREIQLELIALEQNAVARKLVSRLARIRAEFIDPNAAMPSLFGEQGVMDG